MKYFECVWKHEHTDEPLVIYSEIDDARWEQRKVERFRDGRLGYATHEIERGGTMLGLAPWPENVEIESDPQFKVREITKLEFETLWQSALTNG